MYKFLSLRVCAAGRLFSKHVCRDGLEVWNVVIRGANCIRIFEYFKIRIADTRINPNLRFEDSNPFGSLD